MIDMWKALGWITLVLFGISILSCSANAESRKIVAVVDTGYNPLYDKYLCKDYPIYDVTGKGIYDKHGHGTNILGLITKGINPSKQCLVVIKWFHSYETMNYSLKPIVEYLNILRKIKPAFINLSMDGGGYLPYELSTYLYLTSIGTKIVVSAGNHNMNLGVSCKEFPACYTIPTNYYVVGSKEVALYSNYGGPVRYKAKGTNQCSAGICMTGTSQSAANFMAELLRRY